MKKPRNLFIIDFALMEVDEARQFPVLFDIVRTRVKPHRDANNRKMYRDYWWRFGEPRREFRRASRGLPRFIAKAQISEVPVFTFLPESVAPDNMLVCFATAEGFHLGVLSSELHRAWAEAAGGTLEDRPVYNLTLCFDAFPFPNTSPALAGQISALAEKIDAHRRSVQAPIQDRTFSNIYAVVDKLRRGEELDQKQRRIYEGAACGVLLDLHTELDALVAEAYGWPWPMEREEILQRLVDLHDERVKEEKVGKVRWLRPDYQIPRFGKDIEADPQELDLGKEAEPVAEVEATPWPSNTIHQIGALQDLLNRHPSTLTEAATAFKGARKDQVERHLETLVIMGEAWTDPSGVYHLVGQ